MILTRTQIFKRIKNYEKTSIKMGEHKTDLYMFHYDKEKYIALIPANTKSYNWYCSDYAWDYWDIFINENDMLESMSKLVVNQKDIKNNFKVWDRVCVIEQKYWVIKMIRYMGYLKEFEYQICDSRYVKKDIRKITKQEEKKYFNN